jgi:Arm DNA-binding domain
MKLTAANVATLDLPTGRSEAFAWDSDLSGFGVRLRSRAKSVWVFQFRVGPRSRRMALGAVSTLSASDARVMAVKLNAKVRRGEDPMAQTAKAIAKTLEQRVADKYAQFEQAGTEPACYLYRHFDPAGDLLYVGVSLSPLRRNKSHTTIAKWRQANL